MKPLAFFIILLALVALGCASVNDAHRNMVIEYAERGGLSAAEYNTEAEDEGLDSLTIDAKYFGGDK